MTNRNPKTPPLIDPNYLHVNDDVDCMISSIKLAIRLVQSEVLQSLNPKIHWPRLRYCSNFGPSQNGPSQSNRYLECLLRTISMTAHHPGGTCAMGSTVDNRLRYTVWNFLFHDLRYEFYNARILGIDGIRIADASILPTTIAGTPNEILILIGKHASDMILDDLNG